MPVESGPLVGLNAAMTAKWHLSYARGYTELGLLAEAAAELELVGPATRQTSEFLEVQAVLFQEQKKWAHLQEIAEELCRRHPDNPSWWIMYAYGARRAESIERAEAILLDAHRHHPHEATILFNLGCYACQRGDLTAARVRVDQAIAIDPHFREAAASDPDLSALRSQD